MPKQVTELVDRNLTTDTLVDEVHERCLDSLTWASARDYAGWDPYDGLNSRLLGPLARTPTLRLLVLHSIRVSPINLRPTLQVPKGRNPKGIALFADAYLSLFEQTGDVEFLHEAEELLDWLSRKSSDAFDRYCWGYNFDWQSSYKFFLPAYHPCMVVTVFCGRAFLRHHRLTGNPRSLAIAEDAGEFLRTSMNRIEVGDTWGFSYTPYDSFVVVNANALVADYLYKLSITTDDHDAEEIAESLFRFVCDVQESNGAWYYAVPPSESHLSHDNFHTGFVLESLYEFAMDQPEDSPERRALDRGLSFYRGRLFDADGAPRFEADTRYPYDVHASAQAMKTFCTVDSPSDRQLAYRVYQWTMDHLYDESGYFYRRTGRVLTDRTPYMRWSQAWMANALATYRDTLTGE